MVRLPRSFCVAVVVFLGIGSDVEAQEADWKARSATVVITPETLSDPANKVAQEYETYIPNPQAGKEGDLLHGTFVISRQGKVVWANRGDAPFTENRTLLHEIARIEGRTPAQRAATP